MDRSRDGVHISFGKLWMLIMPFPRAWKVLKKSFSKWLWKGFGFLFGTISNYPKIDVM